MKSKNNEERESTQEKLRHAEHYSIRIELLIGLRHTCNLSAEIAAEMVNIGRATLSRYEAMRCVIPTLQLTELLDVYNTYIEKNQIEKDEYILKLEKRCAKIYCP